MNTLASPRGPLCPSSSAASRVAEIAIWGCLASGRRQAARPLPAGGMMGGWMIVLTSLDGGCRYERFSLGQRSSSRFVRGEPGRPLPRCSSEMAVRRSPGWDDNNGGKEMIGPRDDFREYVAGRAHELETEDQLLELLAEIEREAHADAGVIDVPDETDEGDAAVAFAEDLLASVEAWISIVSYALGVFYAPASPWRRDKAGWAKDAVEKSRALGEWLVKLCGDALRKVGVSSLAVGAAFPFGITVSASWNL
jgi:hypothetical protein